MLTRTLVIVFCLFHLIETQAQLNTVLQSNVDYTPNVNDVWGYAAGGREYALVGLNTAVNIQDVTDPANPVDLGTASGFTSVWRDIKTFGTYAYVTNDDGDGVMIIDLSNLPAPITASDYWDWEPNIPGLGVLSECHNLYIDGAGYMYLAGCNLNNGGILYVDVFTDPENPAYIDKGNNVYAHDVFVDGTTMYCSEIYQGEMEIYQVSADKTSTLSLGSVVTPNSFTHNIWSDGSIAFTTDEKPNASTAAYDVSDPSNIVYLDAFKPLGSINTGVIPHNVHIHGGHLVISHYSDGLVIVDASQPDNLIEVGNYDTYTGGGTGGNGAWGAYPYLPSGNILVTDRADGLFVVTPTYVIAARLEGIVTDMTTGNPITTAEVTIVDPQANQGLTNFMGEYKTGIASSGTFDVTVTAPGYVSKTVSATITNGVITVLNVQLSQVGLPIELVSFDVEKKSQEEVALSWLAVANHSLFNFDIEKSFNGTDFFTVSNVQESGEIGIEKNFQFTDRTSKTGKHYYRLKSIDPDRSFDYSEVKSVTLGDDLANGISIYPNPLNDDAFLNIEIPRSAETLYLKILNAQGQLMHWEKLRAGQLNSIDARNLSQDLNLLIIENDYEIIRSEKVILR